MTESSARNKIREHLEIPYISLEHRFAGRSAIITGAAQGIGRAIARRLGWEGADLIITDLPGQRDKLKDLMDDLSAAGVKVEVVVGDATQRKHSEEVVKTTLDRFGRIDVLINNVGGGILIPFMQKTEEQWQTEIQKNLIPTLRFCELVLPHMVQRRYGRVVMIGAESVRNGLWEHAGYNAAKGGVHGFTTGLARELAPHTITVNTVAPSIVSTEVVQASMARGSEMCDRYIGLIPMKRPATMGEVAAATAFIASDDASFITGQVISVNGGSSML